MNSDIKRTFNKTVRSINSFFYNSFTSVKSSLMALSDPEAAAIFRTNRNRYRTFIAGERGNHNDGWLPLNRSGDEEVKRGYRLAVSRARDQIQNNPFISGGVRKITNNVVRAGILPVFKFEKPNGDLDTEGNLKWLKMFLRWSKYSDITGHDTVFDQQVLGLRHMWSDGQFLIRRIWDNSLKGIVPLRLQFIECDQIDPLINGYLENGNFARKGVEYDPVTGMIVAIHLLPYHPGDNYYIQTGKTIRIAADDIKHIYQRDRISQYSGISWLVSVIMEAFDLETFREFERVSGKAERAFAVFVENSFGNHVGFGSDARPGAQAEPDEIIGPDGTKTTGSVPTEVNAGRIQYLPQGMKATGLVSNRPGSNYVPFVNDSKKAQSVGMQMSYEAFANDFSGASYSSTRQGSLEERLSYKSQQNFVKGKINNPIVSWFIHAAWLAGMNPTPMRDFASEPHKYYEMVTYQDPGWSWVDPLKDGKSAELKIKNTLSTRNRICAESGIDFNTLLLEAIQEEKQMTELYKIQAQNNKILEGNENNATGKQSVSS